jgi:SAM-dependent methyltransferase
MSWQALWSAIVWGGLLVALLVVTQRRVRDPARLGPEVHRRTLHLRGLALIGLGSTWTFMIRMTVDDVARYPDFAAWLQRSQLLVDAYREVTADPAAWWWTSQLLVLTLGLIAYLHTEAERRGFRAWPYVWLGLCVAVSAALPLFAIGRLHAPVREPSSGRGGTLLGVVLVLCSAAVAAVPWADEAGIAGITLGVHGLLLTAIVAAGWLGGAGARSVRSTYVALGIVAVVVHGVATAALFGTGAPSPLDLTTLLRSDARLSIGCDLVLTIVVVATVIAHEESRLIALAFVVLTPLISPGAAFLGYLALRERRHDFDLGRLNAPSSTRWGNLGLWQGQASYPQAAEALARRLGEAATLAPDDRVLDVACGEGESVRLWLDHFDVATVVAIEAMAGRARRAKQRFAAEPRARIALGDATHLDKTDASTDVVLCVDSAYHFRSRQRFFAEARRVLVEGGRLGLTDLVLLRAPASIVERAWLVLLATAAGIPMSNLVSVADYQARLVAAGFGDVQLERLDAEVLGGFARHLAGSGRDADATVSRAGRAIHRVMDQGLLGYVLATARRDTSAQEPVGDLVGGDRGALQ